MQKSWLAIGTVLYLFVLAILLPVFTGIPWMVVFQADASHYSLGAMHIVQQGFYSIDGLQPFMEREPGMSFFLAVIYLFFGVENALAVVSVQAVILFLASWFFCSHIASTHGHRVAGIAFILLLTSGSVFHTVFSAYRECLALSVLLLFSSLFLWHKQENRWWKPMLMGLTFGVLILTYYTFLLFPPALLFVWWIEKRPLRESAVIIVTCYALVGLWGLRNASYDGEFRVIDSFRTTIMWYVRGEQAEKVRGFEPFRCLWSEYISRDWSGRSSACSTTGVFHQKWPDGTLLGNEATIARDARAKILRNFPGYLNFSLYEILELHLPFVGGGWSTRFNAYAALSAFVMYLGFLFGVPTLVRREHVLWLVIIGYNTAIFILTDATPRYLLPVIFCYALFAGIGYDRLLKRFQKNS